MSDQPEITIETVIEDAYGALNDAMNTWLDFENEKDLDAACDHICTTATLPIEWEWQGMFGVKFSAK